MSTATTIAALASGWGHSRFALIRLSGPAVPAMMAAMCRPAPARAWAPLVSGFRVTDDLDLPTIAVRYDAPRSFTGENAAELAVPGNPIVVERVLARLVAWGDGAIREAQPGEFSARAFLHNKLTLDQAEGVAAVIAAQTESQLAAAESLLSGRTGSMYRDWGDRLATLLALVEAGIDFTDQEDVVPIAPARLAERLEALLADLRGHLGTSRAREQPAHAPRAVLVGPPNAGKSTLFNALLGRRRAVESPVAGTTRDALVEPLDLSVPGGPPGLDLLLIDLPGLDSPPESSRADPLNTQVQAQASDELARADVLVLCDPRGRFDLPVPVATAAIRVRTKADLPTAGTLPAAQGPADTAIPLCALDGWNLDVLRRALADAAWGTRDSAGACLPARHRRAIATAAAGIAAAAAQIDPHAHLLDGPETIATELRTALDALAELTGGISPDDIIGRVFATFCVGK